MATVVGQFHHPHGIAGRAVGWTMAHRSSNVARNRWAVSLLDIHPTDRVLEVGFGPGIAIEAMSHLATQGAVYGVDHSAVMVRMARRRNRAAVRAGRVVLMRASAADVTGIAEPLDAVLAVNSLGFWPDPAATLAHLHSLLRPGGRIAVVSQPRCPGATAETSARAAAEIEQFLIAAGFTPARTERLPLQPPVVFVLAAKKE